MPAGLQDLPDSTFWRVSVKALVFDAKQRLLVFMDKNHEWEVPGGGWEHGETFEACVARELAEEVRVAVVRVGGVEFCYRSVTSKGYPKLNLAAKVTLDSMHFFPSGDGLAEAGFVTRDEFLKLPFQKSEQPVIQCVDQIWPPAR